MFWVKKFFMRERRDSKSRAAKARPPSGSAFHGNVGGEFLDQVRRAPPHAEVRADAFIHFAQVQAGSEFSESGHGNTARFFGNHQRQTVGLLGDADGRAVARAEAGRHRRIDGQRQKAVGGRDPVLLHDHRAIVQGAARMKDGQQQVARQLGVQPHAAFDEGAQSDVPLDHDQRAGFIRGQAAHRDQDIFGELGPLVAAREPALASQARQRAADLGLEQYDYGQRQVRHDIRKHRAQRFQARIQRDHIQRHHDQDADQNVAGAGALDDHQGLIDQERDHQDVDDAGGRQAGQRDQRGAVAGALLE
jgi:hypothetical protein